jgi:HEAT repeat protein
MTAAPSPYARYLESIIDRYEKWWEHDALTTTIAARQATFTFEQIVQTEEKDQFYPERGQETRMIRLPLISGIQEYAKAEPVLLVGSPGVGKTSALLRCLVEYAKQELAKPEPEKIPVLIRLRNYDSKLVSADDRSGLLAMIQDALEPELSLSLTEIKTLLFQEKRLILLLDGLNEMPASATERQGTVIDFQKKCAHIKIPFICTTRELGSTLGIERKLVIQPPAPEEIDRFLHECIPTQSQKVEQLLNRDRRELSRTPFVLWMLYHVIQETGDVADSLGEAFRQFFQSFKGRLEAAPVTDDRRKAWDRWLRHLAFTMLSSPDPQDPGLVISEDDAEKVLFENFSPPHETPLLSELLKYHLLQEVKGEISFQHQLIQEYYAAEALLPKLKNFTEDELKCYYLNYLKWTEPIALMLALLEDDAQALRVVKLALKVDLMLGARLAGEVKLDLQEKTIELMLSEKPTPRLMVYLCGATRSDKTIPTLRKAIINNSHEVDFRKIIEAIGKSGSQYSIKILGEILENEHYFLAAEAARVLGSINNVTVIPLLTKALQNGEPYTRAAVASVFRELRSIMAAPSLLLALEDNDSKVQWNAICALVEISGEAVVRSLFQILIAKNNFQVEKYAAIGLGKLGYKAAIPTLQKALADPDSQVASSASYAMTIIGNETTILYLAENILSQDDKFARTVLVANLKGFDQKLIEEFAIPYFTHALQVTDPFTRCKAAEILGKIGNHSAIPKLLQATKDRNSCVRWYSIVALGEIGNQDVIPVLLQFLNEGDLLYCESIAIALGLLGYKNVVPTLQQILQHACPDVCLTVLKALRIIDTPEAIQILLHESENQIDKIRHRAIHELGSANHLDKLSALRQAVLSKDSVVCQIAVRSLGKEGSKNETNLIIQALQSNSNQVRAAAAEALGEIGDEEAIPFLLKAFESKSSLDVLTVFPKVAETLGKIGSQSILPDLKRLLIQSDIEEIFNAMNDIQNRCKFYNYDFYQQARQQSSKDSNSVEDYIKILQIIHNAGKEIERKPLSFGGMSEESLRDVFLIALNAGYLGQCTGETFNKKGKTDILIRVGSQNIFIGECKFWGGEQKLKETLDQLLGYVTWRDDQLALLFFNRNKNFSAVLEQIPKSMRKYPNFICGEERSEDYFSCLISHPDDPPRQLKLAVLAFDVPP